MASESPPGFSRLQTTPREGDQIYVMGKGLATVLSVDDSLDTENQLFSVVQDNGNILKVPREEIIARKRQEVRNSYFLVVFKRGL